MNAKIAIALVAILVLAGLLFTRLRPAAPAPGPVAPTTAEDGIATRPASDTRLPAPSTEPAAAPVPSPPQTPFTNVLTRLFHNQESIHLRPEEVEPFLAANRRNAVSLLAAFRTTGDTNFLKEAMEQFPRDPMVDFAALFQRGASSDDRRQWLEAFKASAPDNALANYLSAFDHFKVGRNDQALQELQAASGKTAFQDYSLEFMQNSEEAYRAAGYTEAEAKALAFTELLLPHLRELKQTGVDAISLAQTFRQAGDEQSAQAILQFALNLGRQLQNPGTFNPLINEIVGVAIERMVLDTMNPAGPYGGTGQTVQERFDQLVRYRDSLQALVKQTGPLLETLPEPDLIGYFDRTKVFGEQSAMQWLMNKYGLSP